MGPSRIVVDSTILAGKPIVSGTRLSVEFIIGLLAGWSVQDISDEYPGVTADDVRACLDYAARALRAERVLVPSVSP